MSISATHSTRMRTRRRTKNSTITIMDMIMIMVNRARKKMTSWVIYILMREPGRKLGNLYNLNCPFCNNLCLRKDMKHIPLHFIA